MWGSCKKDLDDSIENISEPISNLEETPEALLGSWNLRQNNSNIDSVVNECEAENIHFLDNDSFYLHYHDRRVKGTYEIASPTNIDLSIG